MIADDLRTLAQEMRDSTNSLSKIWPWADRLAALADQIQRDELRKCSALVWSTEISWRCELVAGHDGAHFNSAHGEWAPLLPPAAELRQGVTSPAKET